MEASILNSTKKVLGLAAEYDVFDHDILTHINATFSILSQLGVGPEGGYFIEDEIPVWTALGLDPAQMNLVRSYVFLKVKLLFDPPQTSYLVESMNKQIGEFEWRLNVMREEVLIAAAAAAEVVP